MEIGTGNQPTFSHLQVKYKMDRNFFCRWKIAYTSKRAHYVLL